MEKYTLLVLVNVRIPCKNHSHSHKLDLDEPLIEKCALFSWSLAGSATADYCVDVVYRQLYRVQEKDRDSKAIEMNTYKCLEWIGNLEKILSKRPSKKKYICTNG